MRPVSISAAPYDGYEPARALDSLAACGVRHVEPAFIVGYTEPFDETAFGEANARRYQGWLAASGLACHAFSSHIDLGRADAVPVLTGRMEFAAALGARVINTNAARGWSFTVPGEGEIDCDAIMAALAAAPSLPFAVELPLRMRRRADAQPVRRPEPVPLAAIEAAVRGCLAYVRRWVPAE